MSSCIVEIKNLKKYYFVKKSIFHLKPTIIPAINDLVLDIKEGEILGLVGASGSGKTTCGKILARITDKTEGNIFFRGKEIFELRGREILSFRRKVQMIFQDPYESLNPRMVVQDIVSEPLVVHGIGTTREKRDMVERVLEAVNLTPPQEFLMRFPHELSGGQRQRVAIARATVLQPELLICDEPVSMLDVSIRSGILNLFLDLKKKFSLTLIFITHDLLVAEYLCDRIAVMKDGKIVEIGNTDKIIQSPQNPYTKELLRSSLFTHTEFSKDIV